MTDASPANSFEPFDPASAFARWSKAWEDADLFKADPKRPGEPFSVVIPPPNITGRLHMGHALNHTIQDVLCRYKRMCGYNVLWLPGTDHAGIATQYVVRRQLEAQGIDYRELGREAFIEKVWAWRETSGAAITDQIKRMGQSCDWSRERFTMDADLQRAVTEHFVRLYEQGLIYQGERLVNWDPVDQTAVSDLEVVHRKDSRGNTVLEKGELFSFAYPLSDGSGEIVVATTRAETLLGDTAVAVHPDDDRYKHLIGKTVRHPFQDRHIPIVGDAILVDPEFGTGAVKITPAHDFNDFEVGERHGLPKINIFNDDATLNHLGGERFAGLDRYEAREQIKAELEALGLHRGVQDHELPIGRSERSGAVIEPYLSTQWFVKMDPLAAPALAAVEHGATRFVPQQWENTYFSWMRNIRDWCVSRQLWWGHRIPAYTCNSCGKVHVARSEPDACEACGGAVTQVDDTLDTWFSSALWPFSTLGWPDRTEDLARYYPTSVLVTGFDIIFFWVARMMVAGIHFTGQVPFKDVYIHALVRDANRQKMSKTKGNVVDPMEVVDSHGADAFRFALMALAAQGRDIVWDPKRVDDAQRFSTKVWNTLRFTLMNLEGYDASAPKDFGVYDRWIAARTGAAVARVREAIDAYRFNDAAHEIHAFVWGELCDWYLELSKTVLYDDDAPAARRQAVQHTLVRSLTAVSRLLHPFMPFFSEELASRIPGHTGLVAASAFPDPAQFPSDASVLDEVALVQEAISAIRNVRGEMELSPRVPLEVAIQDAATYARLAPHAVVLEALAGATLREPGAAPRGAVLMIQGQRAIIPLEGIVDLAAEVARLDKVLKKVEKDLKFFEGQLNNPRFVDKAPEDRVEEVREKLALAKARHEALSASRAALAEIA